MGPGRDGERCTTAAAAGGQLDALRYLRGRWQCQLAPESAVWAARGGHVDVLRWLASQGLEMDARACAAAAAGGWMEALQFLRTSGCEWDESTCALAAVGGHLEVLKWARSQDPPCPWSRSDCRRVASDSNHQHIVKWIDQQEDESDPDFEEDFEYGPDAWLSDPDFEDWMYSDTDSDINW